MQPCYEDAVKHCQPCPQRDVAPLGSQTSKKVFGVQAETELALSVELTLRFFFQIGNNFFSVVIL